MIASILGGVAANPWMRVALRQCAFTLTIVLSLLSIRRSEKRAGRLE